MLVKDVPSMGFKAISYKRKASKTIEKAVLVNPMESVFYQLEIDERTGAIKRLFDKEFQREVFSHGQPGNQFKLYEDIPNLWDAWDVDVFYEEVKPTRPEFKGIVSCETGEVYTSMKLLFEDRNCAIEQWIRLYHHSRRIDFETRVDWQEKNKMLRVEFPVNIRSSTASFEIQYGHVFRNTHENTDWDIAQFEVVAHKWADISQPNYGVGIINDCKYGHKIKGNVISLNLLRSPKTPDPDSDMHMHEFRYALYPHAGDMVQSDLIRQAYQFNIPLEWIRVEARNGPGRNHWSFVEVSEENVVVEVIKKAEKHEGVLIRAYEAKGCDAKVDFKFGRPVKQAKLVNLMERELGELKVTNDVVSLEFNPFEIHSFVVS